MDFENYKFTNYGWAEHDVFWHYMGEEKRLLEEKAKKESFEEKLNKIKQVFYSVKYLGLDKDKLKLNQYYYNDLFDKLYEMSDKKLNDYVELMNRLAVETEIKNNPTY